MLPPTLTELTAVVDDMIESINRLPPHAMVMPINQYDHQSILLLFKAFLSSMASTNLSRDKSDLTDLGNISS